MKHTEQPEEEAAPFSRELKNWYYSDEFGLPLAVFLASACALTISAMSWDVSNPSRFRLERVEAVVAAMAAFALTFWISRRCKQRITRAMLAAALFPSLLALAVPFINHYEESGRMPWESVLPSAGVLAAGAYLGRMRWFSLCLVGFAMICVFGTYLAHV
jgi:hypothetical protein